MNVARSLRWAALALVGSGIGIGKPAIATPFNQGEVDQSRFIAIAAPYQDGKAHQLLVVEQISNDRACWSESGDRLVQVTPLLSEFDFTGICGRSTDSNGYSVRVGGQDLGWRYDLRVVNRANNLVLMATPSLDRQTPPLEIGSVRGTTTGFAKIHLNPGWRFSHRTYGGQPVGHVYLTHDQDLASLSKGAIASRPAPMIPIQRTPDVSVRPKQTRIKPMPVKWAIAPTPQPNPQPSKTPDVVLPGITIVPRPASPWNGSKNNTPAAIAPPVIPAGNLPESSFPSSNPAATLGFSYRVIVQADTTEHQELVRQLAPGAFRVLINGQPMMQAGLFKDHSTASLQRQMLSLHQLSAQVVDVNSVTLSPLPLATLPTAPTPILPTPESPAVDSAGFSLPEPAEAARDRAYSLWATYYYTHRAPHIPGGDRLFDMAGRDLGAGLSNRDWCAAALQGSVQVVEGDRILGVYNYAGRGGSRQTSCYAYYPSLSTLSATERVRFKRSDTPYGEGVGGNMLVPYRTIAVDRSYIPIGSVLYIPAARGIPVTLPSGQTISHDGYFYAADVGGAITGSHIDVYVGVAEKNPFPFVRSTASSQFTAYVINDPTIRTTLASLHRMDNRTARVGQ